MRAFFSTGAEVALSTSLEIISSDTEAIEHPLSMPATSRSTPNLPMTSDVNLIAVRELSPQYTRFSS